MALTAGATLCLGTRGTLLPGAALIQLLRDQAVSIVTLPPSALAALPIEELPALRTITVAGEAFSADLVARWATGRRFFNLYGPTESTIWATVAECIDASQQPDIGHPIGNIQVYVLDHQLQPVPIGVPGELYIGGVGLARGYLKRPELTAEQFIPHPFRPGSGARLYKTGDLVRYRPDGHLEFLGRIDQQVKLRGFRIELGEIEAMLSQHPAVRESVVLAREDRPGDMRLVAYIVETPSDRGAEARQGEVSRQLVPGLRSFLQERLPAYMVPAAFVLLEALPLTPNGKVDRQALPAPDPRRPELEGRFVAPQTEVERTIAAVWQEVLGVAKVGIHDNFFDLGGHSLLLVRLQSKLRDVLPTEVAIIDLLRYPTVSALAQALSSEAGAARAFEGMQERVEKQRAAMSRRQPGAPERTARETRP
jgi:acyl-coenzyme A synthetase/AMP-(fatty) acid ligase